MKKQSKYHPDDEILRKYLQGELSKTESEALGTQLESDPVAREHFRQMEKIWKLSEGLKHYQSIDKEKEWTELKKRISLKEPGRENGEMDGTSRTKDPSGDEDFSRYPRLNPAFRILRVAAAVLLIAISASLIYYYTGANGMRKMDWVSFNSVDAREELILPDGTVVWLNSGSSLKYPVRFRNKIRRVRLEGEGFFKVVPDKDKPFLVTAGNEASVEVLGTAFNLRNDPESKKVFLHVSEGRVAFYPRGKKRKSRILEKDEQAECEEGNITQRTSIDLNFLSWKNQTLEFENTPLPEVVEQLGRHYRKEIRINGSGMDTLTLTGTYTRQSIQDVLEEISIVLEVEFTDVDGIIQIN